MQDVSGRASERWTQRLLRLARRHILKLTAAATGLLAFILLTAGHAEAAGPVVPPPPLPALTSLPVVPPVTTAITSIAQPLTAPTGLAATVSNRASGTAATVAGSGLGVVGEAVDSSALSNTALVSDVINLPGFASELGSAAALSPLASTGVVDVAGAGMGGVSAALASSGVETVSAAAATSEPAIGAVADSSLLMPASPASPVAPLLPLGGGGRGGLPGGGGARFSGRPDGDPSSYARNSDRGIQGRSAPRESRAGNASAVEDASDASGDSSQPGSSTQPARAGSPPPTDSLAARCLAASAVACDGFQPTANSAQFGAPVESNRFVTNRAPRARQLSGQYATPPPTSRLPSSLNSNQIRPPFGAAASGTGRHHGAGRAGRRGRGDGGTEGALPAGL